MKIILNFTILISLILFFGDCQPEKYSEVFTNNDLSPHPKLSDYQFFINNLKDLNPNKKVLPYDLNTPLFSDYAEKARFVWMPEGTTANYVENGVLDFPLGTILIKNFYYSNDFRDKTLGKQIMETRLLVKNEKEWDSHSYIWNEEQTEANLEIVGDIKNVSWINEAGEKMELDYVIPNKNQCKACHYDDGKSIPIGPKARNLNKIFAYSDGEKNQLEKWAEVGYLKNYAPENQVPKLAVWNDESSGTLHERAMAYLDVNCGHCHNPTGPANTSGLNLIAEQPADLNLGIRKAPVAAGKGTGGFKYSIEPGKPEESIMVYRMESTDPGAMMPELGRRLIHKEGVELIKEWIKEM